MTGWTTPADVKRTLLRRYRSGTYLTMLAEGRPWEPLRLPLRTPTTRDVAADLDGVRDWVRSWHAVRHLRVETKRIGGRLAGANEIPAAVWVDGYRELWAVLGVAAESAWFAEAVAAVRQQGSDRNGNLLSAWMLRNPMRVLDLRPDWSTITETVRWLEANAGTGVFVRQIDVSGADTKFVERHRAVLASILDDLIQTQVDADRARTGFSARYGFREKPEYVRLRTLNEQALPSGFTELTVRVDELAERPIGCESVYVLENEITYLAFPQVGNAIAILGGGYSVSRLAGVRWLADRRLLYWGDIDTHGFGILHRLRTAFPQAHSMLMDRPTLLAHEDRWVRESKPLVAHLDRLTSEEAELYRDLVEGNLGPSVRLEQERVAYPAIDRALRNGR